MQPVRPGATSLLLAVALALAVAAPVLAEHEAPRLGLTPVGADGQFFELTLEPGERADLQVEVASFGHDQLLARTYAADAYSIINGGFGAGLFGEPTSGTTRWLSYPEREITLGPQDALVIDFSVAVPAGTPPGDYIAAVVAENVEPYRGDAGSVALEQVNRVALAVAIDVPGPRQPTLELGAVGHKHASDTSFVTFEVANTGNVHLKPAGEFTLRDAAGSELAQAPAIMDSVYAGSQTLFEAPLGEALAPGDYCAELSLTDEESGAADDTDCLPFTVEPPPAEAGAEGPGSQTIPIVQPAIDAVIENPLPAALIAAAVLVLLLGAFLLLFWRRRRRHRGAAWLQARIGLEEPPWPVADQLAHRSSDPSRPGAAGTLRALLSEMPEVSRAWLTGGPKERVLVVELARGVDPAAGSRMASSLQTAMHDRGTELRMRARFVQGAGPVARVTNGAAPFYVRSATPAPEGDALRAQSRRAP